MSTPVRTIGPKATMEEAAELMSRWGHGGLPVVENGELIGVVGRKNVDKASRHGLDHAPVTGFMGGEPVTVGPDADLGELERILATRGVGRVPVLDGGKLVGIVTRKDVLRAEHGDAYLDRQVARAHPQATERFLSSVEGLLPEDARDVLKRIGQTAAEQGVRAHVVGGFVRDMIIGRLNLDLDIVVEGDGVEFAEVAGRALGARVRVHRRFGTAVIVLDRSLHVDVASSRTEYYSRPGALPVVERSGLRQDLLRRDFTINAMAACLDPDCFGRIADPYGGLKDIESGTVRVLHALSFIDDPTRLLRAARFEVRYGFGLDKLTEQHARRAVDLRVLDEVSGARLREELVDILSENNPAVILERLHKLGVLASVVPENSDAGRVVRGVAAIDEAMDRLCPMLIRQPRRVGVLVGAIAASAGRESCERWLRRLRFAREIAGPASILCLKCPTALKTLQDRRGMKDSRLYRTLEPLAPEVLVNLWALGDDLARSRIEHFAQTLSRIRPTVSGRDLLELGAEPKQEFSAILARALEDRLDGRAVGRQAELANLRRIAHRAGVLPPR
jgi:tRNA nucleotidyltransferase (CCA-adding enzyme)